MASNNGGLTAAAVFLWTIVLIGAEAVFAATSTAPAEHIAATPLNSRISAVAPNLLPASQALALVEAERDQYWVNAKEKVYKSTLELTAQRLTDVERGYRYDRMLHGDLNRREVALTFDDGPHPDYTLKLLQILKANDVHATFFVVGEKAEEYPDLIRAEVAAGDSVGNHTYDHVSLIKIPRPYVATEIQACGDVLTRITGKRPTLFRPPGGDYDPEVAETIASLGYKMILYTDDPGDYAEPGAKLVETRTLDAIDDGGIILLHDGSQQTIDVLPQIIQRLKARGFQFVTVDQMLAEDKPVRG